MLKKNDKYSAGSILVLLMLLALVIRVAVVLTRQMVSGDEVVYARMAEQLAQGNGLIDMLGVHSTIFMPLVSLLIACFSFLLPDAVISGYVVEILFGCLLLIPAYFLGRELVGERIGCSPPRSLPCCRLRWNIPRAFIRRASIHSFCSRPHFSAGGCCGEVP